MIEDNIIDNKIVDYDVNSNNKKNEKNLFENFVDLEEYVYNDKINNNKNNNINNDNETVVLDEDEEDKKKIENEFDDCNIKLNSSIKNGKKKLLNSNNVNDNYNNNIIHTQIINKNKILNSNNINKIENSKNNNQSTIDLINFCSIYDINNLLLNNNNKSGKFFSTLYFNYIKPAKYFNFKTFHKKINIFDQCINNNINDLLILNSKLGTFLYMSYRMNFTNFNIKDLGNVTSDSGWGCTIRSCQMMLSKGLYEIYSTSNMGIEDKGQLLVKIMTLFSDNVLNKNDIKMNLYKNNEFKEFDDFIEIYFNKIYYFVKGKIEKKNMNFEESFLKFIAPFSILILCKLGNCVCRYTSSYSIIKSFIEINNQLFDNKIGIVFYELGYIDKNTIYETFFEKINNFNNNNNNNKDIIKYNNNYYKFNKKGFIFISLRLGLRNLDEIFYNKIPEFFSIRNNIGFVGGKNNEAFYCIGGYKKQETNKYKLIYVNPHFNQDSKSNYKKLDKSYYIYINKLYKLKLENLSSSFLLGVFIKNVEDVNNFFEDIERIINSSKNENIEIFRFKNNQKDDNNNNNINYEDLSIESFSFESK